MKNWRSPSLIQATGLLRPATLRSQFLATTMKKIVPSRVYKYNGFSILEAMIALLLLTISVVVILHQQWQISKVLTHMLLETEHILQIDNNRETSA